MSIRAMSELPCPPTITGRAAEWRSAMRAVDATRTGQQVSLLITGGLGVGKSRFLTELGTAVEHLGFCRATPEACPANDGRPLAYLLDDLHTGRSELTPQVIGGLHTPHRGPALWVVATQQRVHRASKLERYLGLCADLSVRLSLEPLDTRGTIRLARELLGLDPDDGLAAYLRAAGGNPRLISSLILGLRADGMLLEKGGRAGLRGPVAVPRRAREAVEEFLGSLTAPARHVISAAARLGAKAHFRRLSEVVPARLTPLLPAALDELVGAGLLRVDNGWLAFQHPAVRACLAAPGTPVEPPAARAAVSDRAGVGGRSWTGLTGNESAVAGLAAEGLTNAQIARRIGRSTHTVNFHLRKVFKKLNVRSRVELARIHADWRESRARSIGAVRHDTRRVRTGRAGAGGRRRSRVPGPS